MNIEWLEMIENLFMITPSYHKLASVFAEYAYYTIINLLKLLIDNLGNVCTAILSMVAFYSISLNRTSIMMFFVFSISDSNTNNI